MTYNKKEIQQRVLQNGIQLALDKFNWDENTNTFSSTELSLVLDFSEISNCTFKTWANCTFNTGPSCTFDTGPNCTFKTWSNCIFNTGSNCTFDTGPNCTFKTWSNCTFDTGSNCTFDTGPNCVVVRRDIYEVIELDGEKQIKLNDYSIKGYTVINNKKTITIDGKNIEISVESFEELKKQLGE